MSLNIPSIILVIAPLAGAFICIFTNKIKWCSLAAACFSWISFAAATNIFVPFLLSSNTVYEFFPGLFCDRLSASFILLTTFVVSTSLTQAGLFFASEKSVSQEGHVKLFYIFSLLFLLSMIAVFVCDNLGALWISVEATSLLSAGLVYYSRSKHAVEATWKYLIICSVGIAFALLGTIFLFASSQFGAVDGGSLSAKVLSEVSTRLEPFYLKLGFIFCLVGYGTKAGIFPLHSWLPDAHSEAPAPASAMLSAGLLNCALFAIWKILKITQGGNCSHLCQQESLWAGTITVLAASLFLFKEHGLKRLLAYSSIENVGLMLVAIGMGSAPLFFLQALNHSLVKVSLFCLSGNIIQVCGSKELSEISGVLKKLPLNGVLLLLGALAVTGSPPFGTFISEWLLLTRCIDQKEWLVAGAILLALTIAFISVCFHTGRILVGGSSIQESKSQSINNSIIPTLLMTVSLLLGFIVTPQLLRYFQ